MDSVGVRREDTGVEEQASEMAMASLDNFREQQLRMENAWLRARLLAVEARLAVERERESFAA